MSAGESTPAPAGVKPTKVSVSLDLSFEAFVVALALMLASSCVSSGLREVATAIRGHSAAVRSLEGTGP